MMLRLLLVLCLSLVTTAGYATDVYVFGDSLSDTKNNPIPSSDTKNHPILGTTQWVSYIPPYQLIENYAYSGAGTGDENFTLYEDNVNCTPTSTPDQCMSEPANTPNNLAIEQRFKTNNLRTQISLYKTKYAKYGCVNDGTRIHIIWIGTNDLIIDTGAGYSHGYRLIPKYAPSYLPPYMVPITKPTNSGSTWLNVAFPPSLGFNSISQQNLTKAIEELSTCGSVYVLGLYDFSFSRAARGCPPPSTSSCSSSSPNFGVQSYITAVNDRVIKNAVESVKSMGRNVVYIDVYHDVVGGQVEPVEYQLNINSTTADSAIFDGIHLSDDRQRVIARRVCRALGVASSYCASL